MDSRKDLAIMDSSYPQHDRNGTIALVPAVTSTFRLTNRCKEKPAPITTYGVLKSNPILPPEAIKQAGPPKTSRYVSQSSKDVLSVEGGPFRENGKAPNTKEAIRGTI
jgi:hypothetical protein